MRRNLAWASGLSLEIAERIAHRDERGGQARPALERRGALEEQDVEPVDDDLAACACAAATSAVSRPSGR